jgi:hypothetical protein
MFVSKIHLIVRIDENLNLITANHSGDLRRDEKRGTMVERDSLWELNQVLIHKNAASK